VTQPQLLYRSIDDYLGPGETRFFGRGYRRAEYQVGDIVVPPADDAGSQTRATVTIRYPADWSTKANNVHLRPHLSTVDMLVLGVQLSEIHLTHTYGLDQRLRRATWLRKVTLRAGATPQEDLAGLAGSATLRETRPAPAAVGTFVSVYDCAVGAMRARCEIEHSIGRAAAGAGYYESIEDVLGAAGPRYWGGGFKARQQRVEDVRIDMAELRSTATVSIEPTGGSGMPTEGLEGGYQPSVSLIDCFVVNLQLAQVMMYELDSIRRQDSNTLWMLKTVLEADRPHRPYPAPLQSRAAIAAKQLVPLRGATWRNVDIRAGLGGVGLRSSFAHELPADALISQA
jgi:hypothetical protein